MGIYINIGNEGFASARNSEYVDKSDLIRIVNSTLNTERRFSCVTRCRRFGKSMAAKMLNAYYDYSCESRHLFEDLEITKDPQFEQHLNKYPVIYLDMTDFVTRFKDESIVRQIDTKIAEDVRQTYPDVKVMKGDDLMDTLVRIYGDRSQKFIFIIDEWDAICREFRTGTAEMDNYVNWLRRMFKSVNASTVFAAVYMTGILPIKKYKTESALNNFTEYSMVDPIDMGRYFGFTRDEVRVLAGKHQMDFEELVQWYDGYQIGDEPSIFNPNSVMMAIRSRRCRSYWSSTGAFDAVADYIQMNYEGLKDDVLRMLTGGRCFVDPTGFQNDMSVIHSKDDVLTVLIHLGYLSYDWHSSECYVPNYEVTGEIVNAVKTTNWNRIAGAIERSRLLLKSTLNGNEEEVAQAIDLAHDENTSILSYNNENSLACVLSIAYYYANNDYVIHREYASGKGFADLVLIPRRNTDSPAIIIELKYDQHADTALDQIRRKEYPAKVAQYANNLLLVGINYDPKTKKHNCRIESVTA